MVRRSFVQIEFQVVRQQNSFHCFAIESLLARGNGSGAYPRYEQGEQRGWQLLEGWLIAILSEARSRVLHREFRFPLLLLVSLLLLSPSFHLHLFFLSSVSLTSVFHQFCFSFCISASIRISQRCFNDYAWSIDRSSQRWKPASSPNEPLKAFFESAERWLAVEFDRFGDLGMGLNESLMSCWEINSSVYHRWTITIVY